LRLHPLALPMNSYLLDGHGQHWWSPLAPLARIEVDLKDPQQRWSGAAYLDTNGGAAPLEQDFAGWHWLRAGLGPKAAVLYDVMRNDGTRLELALTFEPDGRTTYFAPPPMRSLGRSAWQMDRCTRCEPAGSARVTRRLLDTPFYARSVIATQLLGQGVTGIHESLSLRRFSSPLIQAMLAFRMPRRARPSRRRCGDGDDQDPMPPAR
jgi:carotenoid 1,2-hydratase